MLGLAVLSILLTTCGIPRPALRLAHYHLGYGTGTSMQPTMTGETFYVWDTRCFQGRSPERRDVICFESPEDRSELMLKRCVAVAGDLLEIRRDGLFVNGSLQSAGDFSIPPESRVLLDPSAPMGYLGPLRVPEGTVFCLGDNGATSYDSRYWGPLPLSAVRGKFLFRYWRCSSSALPDSGLPR